MPPGGTHTYVWPVPERAGPGPSDGSSVFWMYHSHVDEPKDANTGLIGPIIVTGKGRANADGSPKDVDREFINLFMIYDENSSWYLEQNIAAALERSLMTGVIGPEILVNVAYLAVMGLIGLAVVARRLHLLLLK